MTWVCYFCEADVEEKGNGGIIPKQNSIVIVCEDCVKKWEPRGRRN